MIKTLYHYNSTIKSPFSIFLCILYHKWLVFLFFFDKMVSIVVKFCKSM